MGVPASISEERNVVPTDLDEKRREQQELRALLFSVGQLTRACWERFRSDLPEDLDLAAEAALAELIGTVLVNSAFDYRDRGDRAFSDSFGERLREDRHTRWAERIGGPTLLRIRQALWQVHTRLWNATAREEEDPIRVRVNSVLRFINEMKSSSRSVEEISAEIHARLEEFGVPPDDGHPLAQITRRWPWPERRTD